MSSPEITKDDVLKALSTVHDPDLKRPLTELGMIENVSVCDNQVRFEIKLTTTACPLKGKIKDDAENAVRQLPGVKSVVADFSKETVTLGASVPQKAPIEGIRNIIAVSSGKGGVGKSTVAVNLACSLAKSGARVGILDADVYGPNIPLMMGLTDVTMRDLAPPDPDSEEKKLFPPQNHGVKVMSVAFLIEKEKPVIWRGPMLDKLIRQFLTDVAWGELDYLVIDLPPGTGDAQLTIMQAAPVAGAVIVTTPQEVSIHDSRKGLNMFRQGNVPILGIVENMSYYLLPDGSRDYIFGQGGGEKAAEELGVDFLGGIPLVTRLREEADQGRPIVIADPDGVQAKALEDIAHKVTARVCSMGLEAMQPVTV